MLNQSHLLVCEHVVLDLMSGLEVMVLISILTITILALHCTSVCMRIKGVSVCGTVCDNRKGLPTEIVHKRKDETCGFYDCCCNGPILAAVWYNGRFIYFLSTMHKPKVVYIPTKKKSGWNEDDVNCPPLLPDYQQYMRGVDRGDKLIGFCNVGRGLKKWWKRVFSHMIECSILNAYILERHAKPVLKCLQGPQEDRLPQISD